MRSVTEQTDGAAHLAPAATQRTALESLCLILSGDPSAHDEALAALSYPGSRHAIMQAAHGEGLFPALHEALAPFAVHVPKVERIPLVISHESNRRKNRQIGEGVVELAAEAHRRSVEVVALKGAMWVLEDPIGSAGWRPMGDADVLVKARDLDAMRDVLARLGYEVPRPERNRFGKLRFEGHYHLIEHRRGNAPFVMEIHRDIGWRPMLLPTELIFDFRRPIAPGLSLPCPWHAALHCLIHWQIHHYGYERGIGLNEGLEIKRFLDRDDIDWAALASHVARVGIEREVRAGIAFASEMFRARVPEALHPTSAERSDVARAVILRQSRAGALAAKQRNRLLRLWDEHRFLYPLHLRNVTPRMARLRLWAARMRRMPFIIAHLISIAALDLVARSRAKPYCVAALAGAHLMSL